MQSEKLNPIISMMQFLQNSPHKQPMIPRIIALLFVLMVNSMAMAQYSVSGKVTSGEDQSPLPGVNILVKGSTQGTISDADGRYSIVVPSPDGVLIFSFVGYLTQEVSLAGRTDISVVLATDAKQLNEVVVTALGIEKDVVKLGYAQQKVSGSDFISQ